MIEMLRIYSKGFLENVTIEELTPDSPLLIIIGPPLNTQLAGQFA
jgi:hypothetical protein